MTNCEFKDAASGFDSSLAKLVSAETFGANLRPLQVEARRRWNELARAKVFTMVSGAGAGKTLVFLLRALEIVVRGGAAIVLAPLRNLCAEHFRTFIREVGALVPVVKIVGGDEVRVPHRGAIVITTPEKWLRSFAGERCDLLVIDEAHLLFDRHRGPQIALCLEKYRRLDPARLIAVTSERRVAERIERKFDRAGRLEVVDAPRREVTMVAPDEGENANDVVRRLIAKHEGERIVVFVGTVASARKLADDLEGAAFHSGLTEDERARILADFESGANGILASTTSLQFGVNIEADVAIVRDLFVGRGTKLTDSDISHLLGRAGRGAKRGAGYVVDREKGTWSKERELSVRRYNARYERQALLRGVLDCLRLDCDPAEYFELLDAQETAIDGSSVFDELVYMDLIEKRGAVYKLTAVGEAACESYLQPRTAAGLYRYVRASRKGNCPEVEKLSISDRAAIVLMALSADSRIKSAGSRRDAIDIERKSMHEHLKILSTLCPGLVHKNPGAKVAKSKALAESFVRGNLPSSGETSVLIRQGLRLLERISATSPGASQ
ncbi:MAG: DEAD/DEAH box helicase [Planctomycetes bacterium]|nr:DEAD/DEAH box helicase [Planctomycetota bacterium]